MTGLTKWEKVKVGDAIELYISREENRRGSMREVEKTHNERTEVNYGARRMRRSEEDRKLRFL